MPSTDDRVVAMQFDNAAFEQKVASTISSLDKLKTSLDFANSNKGLGDLSSAARSFDLSGISSALEGISGKFTTMGAVAFSVIQNITNRAVDAGIQLGKSLSLEQVMSGFQEYQVNMNSIQTILANTKSDGSTLDDVNAALDQLNEYSDKTIYNFSQMAKNIGTFTAAGVGLDDSVTAIKGIANLAAISGSNAEQASGAMYQLSQALSAGRVNLMDWQSVVTAGMGGEVFKTALFETGKALGTVTNVPLSATFDEWEAKGGTFRDQMKSGWLTADVLRTTLSAFSGDLDIATLKMMGFSDAAAQEMIDLGKLGIASATEVKTLTQLVSTVKESVGSGWSASFRLIFGDFEEAKSIFTAFNTAIGNIVTESADKRNSILQGWKDFGGRNLLIESIVITFKSLASIINTVKSAFSDVFPPMTGYRLFELTQNLRDFLANLQPTQEQLSNLRHIFVGVFSALDIGWEIVKGVFGVFKELFSSIQIFDSDSGGALKFFADLGDKINRLRLALVDGGQLSSFFENAEFWVHRFISTIGFADDPLHNLSALFVNLKDSFLNTFGEYMPEKPKVLSDAMDILSQRFGWVKDISGKVGDAWDTLKGKLSSLKDELDKVSEAIKQNFEGIPQKIADSIHNADYDTALDTINTGLLGGIAVLVANFFRKDFGIQGFFDNINDALQSVTGTLDAMQQKLKAEVLFKIAEALALLTVSVMILSTINSADLTKSMVALGVGFGELAGSMAILSKVASGPLANAGLTALSGGLILIAGAILILSFAAKNMAGLDWNELAKGLLGVASMLGMMALVVKPISNNSSGLITAGLGMIAIGTALNIMASAVKSFAEMDWDAMGKGLLGVAGALTAVVLAMKFIPENIFTDSLGVIAIAVALKILGSAVKSFAEMDSDAMMKGLIGIGEGLLAIVIAMQLMPENLALQGAGILAISLGLGYIATAVKAFAEMNLRQLAIGLVGMGGALLVIAGAAYMMEGAIPGAIAIGIIALSLGKLADGVKKFSNLSWKDLLFGLGALAGTLIVVGLAGLAMAPIIPTLLGLGLALLAIGGAFALLGAGAWLLATAFAIVATAGTTGVGILLEIIDGFIQRIPEFLAGLAEGLIALGGIILEGIIELTPKIMEALVTFIKSGLQALRDTFPDIISTGFELLMALLTGIRDNIGEITTVVVDIITNFLDALALKVPEIIDSVYNLVVAIIEGVVAKLVDIAKWLLPKGLELLQGLWDGITRKADEVYIWFTQLPSNILNALGALGNWLVQKGKDLLQGLWNGITNIWEGLRSWISDLPNKIVLWIGDLLTTLLQKGKDLLGGLVDGIEFIWDTLWTWALDLGSTIASGVGSLLGALYDAGVDLVQGIINGIGSIAGDAIDAILDLAKDMWNSFLDWFSIASPSKKMIWASEMMIGGIVTGFKNDTSGVKSINTFSTDLFDAMTTNLNKMPSVLSMIENLNPTITPVLDLSNVTQGAGQLQTLLGLTRAITADVSYGQASGISDTLSAIDTTATEVTPTVTAPTEIRFEQHNYSPESLSTADIYRQTRNQIAMAKEELAIL